MKTSLEEAAEEQKLPRVAKRKQFDHRVPGEGDGDGDGDGDGTWRPLRPRCLGRGEAGGRSRATAMVRMVSSIWDWGERLKQ